MPALSCVGVSRCISHPLLHISVGGGLPVFFLEVALGQFTSEGGITCWGKLCPIFTGETNGRIEREWEREDETVWLWWYLMTHRAQAHFNQHKSYFIMLPSPCRLVAVPCSSVDQSAWPLLRCALSLIGCWSGSLKHLHSDLLSASDAVARQHWKMLCSFETHRHVLICVWAGCGSLIQTHTHTHTHYMCV